MSWSQPEPLFHVDIKELTHWPVFNLVLNKGGGAVKKSLCIIINYAHFYQTIQYQVFALDIGPETEAQKIGKTGLQLNRFSNKTL